MDPLCALEHILGDVESWRTSIIFDIFLLKPNSISLLNVASFMYGNGFLVDKAEDCFVACIGIDCYYVICAVMDLFSIWYSNPYKAHFAKYYSTT